MGEVTRYTADEARKLAVDASKPEVKMRPGESWNCYVDSVALRQVGNGPTAVMVYRCRIRWLLPKRMFRSEATCHFTVDVDVMDGSIVGITRA